MEDPAVKIAAIAGPPVVIDCDGERLERTDGDAYNVHIAPAALIAEVLPRIAGIDGQLFAHRIISADKSFFVKVDGKDRVDGGRIKDGVTLQKLTGKRET